MVVLHEDWARVYGSVCFLSLNVDRDTVDIIDADCGVVYWTGQGPGNIITAERVCREKGVINIGIAECYDDVMHLLRRRFGDFQFIPRCDS